MALSTEDNRLIGEMCTAIARLLASDDPNFLQGNPVLLTMPIQLPDTDLAIAMQLKKRSAARLYTPDGRTMV